MFSENLFLIRKIICTNLEFYKYKLYKRKLFRPQDLYVNNNQMCFNNIDNIEANLTGLLFNTIRYYLCESFLVNGQRRQLTKIIEERLLQRHFMMS